MSGLEVHLDEALPAPASAAGSSTDGPGAPAPTISPTEPFDGPRPSMSYRVFSAEPLALPLTSLIFFEVNIFE